MKSQRKFSLLSGTIIIILIISSPYFLYLYQTIPSGIENYDSFLGVIKGGNYVYAQNYIYYLFAKLVPLFLLFFWFVTNKHWWGHAHINPISVYLFQLISVINDSEAFMDEVEFIYTVPITVIIVSILYFLRSKLSIYIQAVDLKKEMDKTMGDDF